MSLTLITGPMKSGKTLELIARVAPYKFADKKVLVVQSLKNTRETSIVSRSGISVEATGVSSLSEITDAFDVIGIDEINMFDAADSAIVGEWLKQDKVVVISGLDLDYRGTLIPIIKNLWELKPEELVTKLAVCDICHNFTAQFSQILHNGQHILEGLPLITPEDGTYEYQARCRNCFIRPASV